MSFLDKIKNKGKNEGNDDFDDGPRTDASGSSAPEDTTDFQPSIITAAQPTPEFQDTSAGYQPSASAPESPTPMPEVLKQPEQRRTGLLTALTAAGVLFTAGTVSMALINGNRSAAQVRGAGQAATQSQRLAKAVSTALLGNKNAFPEMKEAADILTSVTTSLRDGSGELAKAPGSVDALLEKITPMVARAGQVATAQRVRRPSTIDSAALSTTASMPSSSATRPENTGTGH